MASVRDGLAHYMECFEECFEEMRYTLWWTKSMVSATCQAQINRSKT